MQAAQATATAGWYDSGVDTNCDIACEASGLVCTEAELYNHNSDVDTSGEVLALISQVGGTTSDTDCAGTYGSNVDIPQWMPTKCFRSSTSRAQSTFSCAVTPSPLGQLKRRLCYCHQATTHAPTSYPTTDLQAPTKNPTKLRPNILQKKKYIY